MHGYTAQRNKIFKSSLYGYLISQNRKQSLRLQEFRAALVEEFSVSKNLAVFLAIVFF